MDNITLFTMLIGSGLLLYLLGLLFPWVARKGPNNIFGIRTGTSQENPEVWKLMHLMSEVPVLTMGYFTFLFCYMLVYFNIEMKSGVSLLILFIIEIPLLAGLLSSVTTEGKAKKMIADGISEEEFQEKLDASFDRFFSGFLFFSIGTILLIIIFLMLAAEQGEGSHTGLRLAAALESPESWVEVQRTALNYNIIILIMMIGNLFFKGRSRVFKRYLVVFTMLMISLVFGLYCFI